MPRSLHAFLPLLIGSSLGLGGCDLLGLGKSAGEPSEGAARKKKEVEAAPLSYVGREKCTKCHEEVVQSYAWSAHDRSLEVPDPETLAAPFAGEKLSGKKLGGIFVTKGKTPVIQSGRDFEVVWTIGFEPVQQYVVSTERGRKQVFSAAYDTRDKGDGGKKWFFPDGSDVAAGEPQHFLSDDLNWNSSCASCHSTGVQKNFDREKNTYDTEFVEIDVSCEACHGPASNHVKLAEQYAGEEKWPPTIEHFGFTRAIAAYTQRRWVRAPDEKTAKLVGNGEAPPEHTEELTSCAPCHSSREDLGPAGAGSLEEAFDDRYALHLLKDGLYFADGQINGQVYSYGSFLQSKEAAAGVVCSDCHNPHSATLRKPPVELCVTCHDETFYGAESHTMHPAEQEVQCVDCHMPERMFMGVDGRRDHQFGIPRPDLTLTLGTPNACEACHPHRPKWAATVIEERFGKKRPGSFAPAFHAAKEGKEEAPEQLATIVADESQPTIVRATALQRWASLGRKMSSLEEAIIKASQGDEPLLRRVAAEVSRSLPEGERMKVLEGLFVDKSRSVRVAAAVASPTVPPPEKPSESQKKALEEAKSARAFQADRPDGLISLAALEARLGTTESMEELYELAAERYPTSSVVFVDWSTALRAQKKEQRAQEIVEKGLALHPTEPTLQYDRGRWLLRQEKVAAALPFLKGAFEDAPRTLRRTYGYAYAVAVHDQGDWAEALAILRLLKKEYPEAEEVQKAIEIYEAKRTGK